MGEKVTEDAVNKFKAEFIPKFELLTEVDRETIYYDGLELISNELSKIRTKPGYETFRIVIFIDDLDRCSPKRALEIFESVKVFLDVEGFIFVMGLSLTTMAKLVEKEYEGTDIKGRDYIRKIIQIPIFLPAWKVGDTISVIKDLIDGNRLDGAYANFIAERKDILATIIEPNPREIKRFINDFLITYELSELSEPKLDKEALILIRALQFRWDVFYEKFMSDGNFRSAIIAVSSLHVNLEDLNNYLNEEDFGRRGEQMSIMLDLTRRTLNIGQTEEELKKKMEANRRNIEDYKRMEKEEEKSLKSLNGLDTRYIPLGSAKTLDEVREERNKEREQNEKFLRNYSELIKKLEEEYGEMQRRASEEESALRSNTESWNSISTALTYNIYILDAYKAEVNEIEFRLWEVLVRSSKNFSTITNWDDYRRVMGIASNKKIDVITQK